MPTFSCNKKIACPGNDNPLGNFSSEDPDSAFRIGYSTGTAPTSSFKKGGGAGPITTTEDGEPDTDEETADTGTGGDPPPIGSLFDNLTVTTFTKIIDDEDPDTDPGNVNIDQLVDDTNPGAGGWKIRPNLTTRPTVFINQPQTCTINCPDGSPFSFTVPIGRFRSLSQIEANRAAYSYACKQAQRFLVCMGDIQSTACVGTAYSSSILAYTRNLPVTFNLTGGTLPAWATPSQTPNRMLLQGTPTAAQVGANTFTLQVTDGLGFMVERTFTITTFGMITSTELPGFVKNVPYSHQIEADGGTPDYVFTIISGGLPPGLELDEDGLISGTPTVDPALFPIFVRVTDASGRSCTTTFSFEDSCVASVTPALAASYALDVYNTVFSNITGTVFSTVNSTQDITETSANGVVLNTFSIGASSIGGMLYENTNQRIHVGYMVGADVRISSINPVTRAIINTVSLPTTLPVRNMTYDPTRNKLWVRDLGRYIFRIDCATLSYDAIDFDSQVFLPDNGGIVYCSDQDVIACLGSHETTPGVYNRVGIVIINPVTMGYTPTNLGISILSSNDAVYCPDNALIYSSVNNSVLVIDPDAPLAFSAVTLANFAWGVGYNPCTRRILAAVSLPFGAPITMYYIRISDNTVIATVNPSANIGVTGPTNIWYDSTNARHWYGTGNGKLLKFT